MLLCATSIFLTFLGLCAPNTFMKSHVIMHGNESACYSTAVPGMRYLWGSIPVPWDWNLVKNGTERTDKRTFVFGHVMVGSCVGRDPGYEGCYHPNTSWPDYTLERFEQEETNISHAWCKRWSCRYPGATPWNGGKANELMCMDNTIYNKTFWNCMHKSTCPFPDPDPETCSRHVYHNSWLCVEPFTSTIQKLFPGDSKPRYYTWEMEKSCLEWAKKTITVPKGYYHGMLYFRSNLSIGCYKGGSCDANVWTAEPTLQKRKSCYAKLKGWTKLDWNDVDCLKTMALIRGMGNPSCESGCQIKDRNSTLWLLQKDGIASKYYKGTELVGLGHILLQKVSCNSTARIVKWSRKRRDTETHVTKQWCEDKTFYVKTRGEMAFLDIITLGVGTKVKNYNNINGLACALSRIGNATMDALSKLSIEFHDEKLYSEQNRIALDFVLLKQGGVCKLIGPDKCIVSIHEFNLTDDISAIKQEIDNLHVSTGFNWSWEDWWKWIPLLISKFSFILILILVCILFPIFRDICRR